MITGGARTEVYTGAKLSGDSGTVILSASYFEKYWRSDRRHLGLCCSRERKVEPGLYEPKKAGESGELEDTIIKSPLSGLEAKRSRWSEPELYLLFSYEAGGTDRSLRSEYRIERELPKG